MRDARIERFRAAVEMMSRGEPAPELPVDGDDDLARLGRALVELARAIEHGREETRLLAEITHKVNAGFLLEEVADYLYDAFRVVIPYERIGLSLLDADGVHATAVWARSDWTEVHLPVGYSADIRGSSLETILRTGEPRIINDLEAYLREHPESRSTRLILAEGIRSSLTCPLVARGRPFGFMFFSSIVPGCYADSHARIFRALASQLAVILDKGRLSQQIVDEGSKSRRLLHLLLPAAIAERLRNGEDAPAERFDDATVVFADIVAFTHLSGRLEPQALVDLLDQLFQTFDRLSERHGVEKIKTVGDAYLAVAGVPVRRADHVAAAADLALDMMRAVDELTVPGLGPVRLRIGIHTGPVIAGVIGRRRPSYDVWGDTVNTASRMESQGLAGRIQLSDASRQQLPERFQLVDRGLVQVKGKGRLRTWFLVGRD